MTDVILGNYTPTEICLFGIFFYRSLCNFIDNAHTILIAAAIMRTPNIKMIHNYIAADQENTTTINNNNIDNDGCFSPVSACVVLLGLLVNKELAPLYSFISPCSDTARKRAGRQK